ncbi:MAG: NAD(P)/FAD-dependent oxidoreductase [Devosiaceae bacterium]
MSEHTTSWYAASLPPHLNRLRAPLGGDLACDVCIIGSGFTGVSAAYHLARAGQRVVLLDGERVGWGASGRNGGQLHPGFRQDLKWFTDTIGLSYAQKVHAVANAALAHLDDLITQHNLPCNRTHGLITACRKASDLREEQDYDAFAQETFSAKPLEVLDQAQTEAALGTSGHMGAVRDTQGGHIHPLAFVTALADEAEKAGAQIYDQTHVTSLDVSDLRAEVRTARGTVRAQQVVLAGNGYMRGLAKQADAKVLPITNFMVATKPIGAGQVGGILPGGDAASDTRFVVRYWRPTPDGRLLFGGGEKFSKAFPRDIEGFVRPYLAQMYPALKDVEIDHAWGGTLAITPNRLPLIRRLAPRVTIAAGFSGQGVINAPFAGKIIADALNHDPALLDVVSRFPLPTFPGGTALRGPILFLAMSYFALKDRIG